MVATIDFYCPENGNLKALPIKIVALKMPAECCGIKTELARDPIGGISLWLSSCQTHLYLPTYKQIWDKFGPTGTHKNPVINGCSCTKCGEYYEYAEAVPNFKCYGCKVSWG